jgi:glycosyltransferase involved in cell wall biosynthesis
MLFSITIPAYKCKYLPEAIHSVLDQTYPNFELIIVNDASPEDLDSVVATFDDPRIYYYKNEKNCGAVHVVDNWNICLSYAKGDYVICMGDDDRLLPNCLEEYVKIIHKYPSLEVYHVCTEIIDENGKLSLIQQPRPEWESALSLLYNRWANRHHQYIGDFCYQTLALKDKGGFYKLPLAWGSDDISAVRAALSNGIANVAIPGFQYRVNTRTISNTGNNLVKLEALKLEKLWYQTVIQKWGKVTDLSRLDMQYLECLNKMIDNRYITSYQNCICGDIKANVFHAFNWIKCRHEYRLSLFMLGRFIFRSLFK